MRYQFYREHKYVSAALNDLERTIAKTDFRNQKETQQVNDSFQGLTDMLKGHAQYENERLHTLLQDKHSTVYEHAESDHAHQDEELLRIQEAIEKILSAQSDEEKLSLGYHLYLSYRKFVADNLAHLHEEETLILPELQRLYSDEELQQVEAKTYCVMTSEQMIEMMQVLFPHMNPTDRAAFLRDIKQIQPEKFAPAWQGIAPTLTEQEQADLVEQLQIANS